MRKNSQRPRGKKISQDQKKMLHVMTLPLIVVILIIIILIAERGEKEEVLPDPPTAATMEPGMTAPAAGALEEMGERLPEEPGDEPDETQPEETERETEPGEQDAFATERFRRDGEPEVLALMESYFRARELADAEAMNQIYGIGEVSSQALEEQSARMRNNSKYVQGFENIVTYVMDGENANSWLVYAVADINFYSSKTRAPMILWCYVTVDGEGNYHIVDNRQLSPKALQLVNEASRSEEVRKLAADVNRRLKEALNSDENLNHVYGVLRDGSPVWEGTGETEPEVLIVGEESEAYATEESTGALEEGAEAPQTSEAVETEGEGR
ncbi:MAG: hypothetical protein HFG54_02240 [Lachnospiraceae bacterium]|jgi:hypothetical protein|nr:hypothetical protein [Lachnospiraceae bacterium]